MHRVEIGIIIHLRRYERFDFKLWPIWMTTSWLQCLSFALCYSLCQLIFLGCGFILFISSIFRLPHSHFTVGLFFSLRKQSDLKVFFYFLEYAVVFMSCEQYTRYRHSETDVKGTSFFWNHILLVHHKKNKKKKDNGKALNGNKSWMNVKLKSFASPNEMRFFP